MADNNLFKEEITKVGFEEAAPDVIAKDMTINEAISCLQFHRDMQIGSDDIDEEFLEALDMAIEALFDEMISAERFKHFATKYGNYKETKNE